MNAGPDRRSRRQAARASSPSKRGPPASLPAWTPRRTSRCSRQGAGAPRPRSRHPRSTRTATGNYNPSRLQPGIAADGTDIWILGPLDAADLARRAQLAAALPPAAHALAVAGSRPLCVVSPEFAVASFFDAVADDLLPRTTAAPLVAGHAAFAAPGATARTSPRRGAARAAPTARPTTEEGGTDVSGAADWLAAVATGVGDEAAVSLRLEPPEPADADFVAVLQLQSRRDPSLVVSAADLWAAPGTVVARFGDEAETALLLSLRAGTSRLRTPA